jgi:hypothetical protein
MSPVQCPKHGLQQSAQLCCEHLLDAFGSSGDVPGSIVFSINWLADDPKLGARTSARVRTACARVYSLQARVDISDEDMDRLHSEGRFPWVAPACSACLRDHELLVT